MYNNLIQELGNEDLTGFWWYFRLPKEYFQEILALLSHDMTKANTKMRSSISAGERLSITLCFLATGEQKNVSRYFSDRSTSLITALEICLAAC